jgi:hypothetical protein
VHETLDPVFGPGQAVAVTVLGHASPPLIATVVEMIGPAVRLSMAESLPTGTAVKMEAADTLLLADVCFCDPASEGVVVGMTVRHMLTALADLTRLGRSLRGEQWTPAVQPAVEPESAIVHQETAAIEEIVAVRLRSSRIMKE